MDLVVTIVGLGGATGFLLLAFSNYFAIARAGGVRSPFAFGALDVYRYAFTVMKRSSETKRMIVGFIGGAAWLPLVNFIATHIAGKRQ